MTVITEEMEVRVRPPRIAVVISSHTTHAEYLRVIEFLSLVRGGQYARFIFADMKTLDCVSFLEHEGKNFQPEIIIGAGEQDRQILRLILENARPQIVDLYDDISQNFTDHQIGNLLPWRRIVRQEYEHQPDLKRDNIYLLNPTMSPDFELFVATLYGKLPKNFLKYIHHMLQATIKDVKVTNAKELYALNTLMSSKISWLDFLNENSGLIYSTFISPKVVVVSEQEPLRGLALYWNISRQYSNTDQESVLLFREQDIENQEALRALAQTISRTTIKSNFCQVVTAEENNNACRKIAMSLRVRLQKEKGETYHVDVKKSVVAPYLQCYEKKQNSIISRNGAIITVPRINQLYDEHHSPSNVWYLDLIKAQKTNRYPFEFDLPKDADILDLLNIPSGQFIAFRKLVSFSEECLSISLASSDSSSNVRFELPSERELFEVIFQRDQWTLRSDEKNTRYTRVLTLFPNLTDATITLTGTSWKIIDALKSGPLTEDSLRGKAKLGKRNKSILLPEIADMVRQRQHGLYGELFERRVKRELTDTISDTMPVEHILEYLVKQNILFRKWKLDQCPGCEREYWETDLDIRKPLLCPGCKTYIPYKDKVRLGYELNPLMQLALDEGIRPVILTARFLRNLTLHGFLMYPGAKLKKSHQETDIDICAIGDKTLIAGECKNLTDFKKDGKILWREILLQLTLPIKVAKACGFRIFFVASLTDRYPKIFQSEVAKIAGDSLKLLFLTRDDLENSRRKYSDKNGYEHTLNLFDLFNPRRPKKPFFRLKDKRKTRTISL